MFGGLISACAILIIDSVVAELRASSLIVLINYGYRNCELISLEKYLNSLNNLKINYDSKLEIKKWNKINKIINKINLLLEE